MSFSTEKHNAVLIIMKLMEPALVSFVIWYNSNIFGQPSQSTDKLYFMQFHMGLVQTAKSFKTIFGDGFL